MKEYQEELSEINSMLIHKNREYENRASFDSLTGLYNRYKFSELYVSTYRTMLQRENKLSLILLDIDHFKRINDTYGHNIGDSVLKRITQTLKENIRNIDIACRWGGEEFLLLLPTATLQSAISIANKIRENIHTIEIEPAGGVTISCGVSEVRIGEEMEEVVERADRALYLAKNSGRNCVKSELDL